MPEPSVGILRAPRAGALVIRGGLLRASSYGASTVLAAATAVFLLRSLGVDDFGRYAAVSAVLAVVSTLSDAGLTAVGVREMSLLDDAEARHQLLGNLVALRLVLAVAAIVCALGFALAAGWDRVMVEGVVLGGIGVLLVNTQATMIAPLSVDLRIGRIALVELMRYAVTLVAVALLSLAGAALLPYFAIQVLVGICVLALTPLLLGSSAGLLPRLDRAAVRRLLRDAAPVGVALAMNVLYLRLLVVLVQLQTPIHETGLYGTAFRVIELLIGVPPLVIGVAIPVLAVAASEDAKRLASGLQQLVEVSVVASLGAALVVFAVATPVVRLLGGPGFDGAGPLLRVQIWALVPLSLGSVFSFALLSLKRQRDIALATVAPLLTVLVLGAYLIHLYEGTGAAVCGVVAETILCAMLAWRLALADRSVLPRLGFVWRPLLALGAGGCLLLLPLSPWVDAALAAVVYAAVAFAVRAVPPELVAAVRGRAA
jgi:O-antigen/teichoic acid export membrane protein